MQKLTSLMLVGLLVSLPLSASEEESDGMMKNHGSKSPPSMEMMDSNGDGEITQEEFDAYRDNMMMDEEEEESEMHQDKMSAFASFDKNKDGVVTEDELAAHAKYSNPGNGTGTLLDDKQKSNKSDRSNKSDKGNKGGNRDNGNSGGDKGGKDK